MSVTRKREYEDKPLFGVTSSALGKEWRLLSANERVAQQLVQKYDLDAPVARIMAARGFTAETADPYLNISLSQLPDPSHFKDMDLLVDRTINAIKSDKKIRVLGDYDVDGATSTSLMVLYGRMIGVDIGYYIPDRFEEGYGASTGAVGKVIAAGTDLLITVDCGTTSFEGLEFARSKGVPVGVIDHHVPDVSMPMADAGIVNPRRLDETGKYIDIAACGMTFMFLIALNRALDKQGYFNASRPKPDLRTLLDIVALGTVADMVPITGVNRVLVARGMEVMARQPNTGIKALLKIAEINRAPLASDCGFQLGPRINAGGRVGDSSLGVQLLTATSETDAGLIAIRLNRYNEERKEIENRITQEAMPVAENQADNGSSVVVVSDEGWHPGVIGIVASRLMQRFSVPAVVIGSYKGRWTGSARSVKGADIGQALINLHKEGYLVKAGGHPMAGGLTVEPDKIEPFRRALRQQISTSVREQGPPVYVCDTIVSPGGVNEKFITDTDRLQPFGQANPSPRVALGNVVLERAEVIGKKQDTIKCTVRDGGGNSLVAMAFRAVGQPVGNLLLGAGQRQIHLVGTGNLNEWQGRRTPQFIIDDAALA